MKKTIGFLIALCMLLSACAPVSTDAQKKQYTATFLDLFDTVTTVVGRADSEEDFRNAAQKVHDELEKYHRLFDIYNEYEGIANLKTVNDQAGIAPVQVDDAIIALIRDAKSYWELTGGRVNPAMGSVLYLWHEARSDALDNPAGAYLPDDEALKAAATHTDFDKVIIDEAASTVYIADSEMRLDVGAVAKGWATQRVSESSPRGLLISVGGNVCATGPKDESGTPWVIGIQNPDSDAYLHTIYVKEGSVVTSGDYQRTYAVGDKLYHHIIDPETLYPSEYFRSVTVVCPDSGLADALSTALFVLPKAEGDKLAQSLNAEVMWVFPDGSMQYTPGFKKMIRT